MESFFNSLWDKIYQTFIFEDRYLFFVDGLKNTLILTFSSFLLGTLFGVLLTALQRSGNKVLAGIGKGVATVLRGIPTMVLLMIMVYIIFGRSSLPLMLIVIVGLTFKAGSYLSEIFNSALDTVEGGEVEAARTLGMNKWQAFSNVVLPQTVKSALPLYINQFVASMQETSVVGYLAIIDLTRASSIVTSRTMDAFFGLVFITLIYFIIGQIAKHFVKKFDKSNH